MPQTQIDEAAERVNALKAKALAAVPGPWPKSSEFRPSPAEIIDLIAQLEAAKRAVLSEAKPVKWMHVLPEGHYFGDNPKETTQVLDCEIDAVTESHLMGGSVVPLYAGAPPAAEAKGSEQLRDARRYRWLTEGKRGDWCWNNVLSDCHRGNHNFLADAIDAAIAAKEAT